MRAQAAFEGEGEGRRRRGGGEARKEDMRAARERETKEESRGDARNK